MKVACHEEKLNDIGQSDETIIREERGIIPDEMKGRK